MSEQETILADIKQAVLSVDKQADVLLFGSRARGDFHEESDWDILILTNEEVKLKIKFKYYDALFLIQLKHSLLVNPIIRRRVDWANSLNTDLYINVHEDGVVI